MLRLPFFKRTLFALTVLFFFIPFVAFGEDAPPVSQSVSNVRVIAGDQSLHISWNAPEQVVDRYVIEIAEVDADRGEVTHRGAYDFTPENVKTVNGDSQQSSYTIQFLPDGTTPLENSRSYEVTVRAERNGQLDAPSAPVDAAPNMINADPPPYPVLFVHGFLSSSTGAFGDTTEFLEDDLGWTPGGNFRFNGSSLTVNPENFDANGDFYTLDFGEPNATYTDGRGLMHQADEISAVVDFLATNGVSPIMIMGHSNGGLAARYYVAHTPQASTKVKKYISYGSPHRGADLSFFGGPNNHGIRDTFFSCSGGQVVYQGQNLFNEFIDNQFLTNLSQDPLPALDDGYITMMGNQGGRGADCHPTTLWDTVVARTSSDLRLIDLPPQKITAYMTDHPHTGQGNRITPVVCALEHTKCANFSVRYPNSGDPVVLQVTSPTGLVVREAGNSLPELIEIPIAELMQVPDQGAIDSDVAMIPLAEPGEYGIQLTPASGSSPTDTFSLVVNIGGNETVLAENMMVQDIPAGGFTVQVPLPPANLDLNGDFMTDILAVHESSGTLVAGLLENSSLTAFEFLLQEAPTSGWMINATGDFNGDGNADLSLYNTITGDYRVVLLNGTTVLGDSIVLNIDPAIGLEPRGVGDFDGDGEAEIIIYHPPSGFTALVYLTNGVFSSFEAVTVVDEANDWTLIDTGDFNQDTKTDLLISNSVSGAAAVIEMDGSVPTGPTVIFVLDPATGWTYNDNADFSGDGKTDVLIENSSGLVGVLVMDGLTFQSIYVPGFLPPGWEIINVGNYDGIAMADCLILDNNTGDLFTAIQDGTTITTFNPVLNLGAGWSYEKGKP